MLLNVFHLTRIVLCVTLCLGSNVATKKICFDEKCSEPLSYAYTTIGYHGDRGDKLSFKPKDKVIVYSKPLPGEGDEWFVEINGKKGYVKSTFLKETKIFRRTDEYLAPNSLEEMSNPIEITEKVNKVDLDLIDKSTDNVESNASGTLTKQATSQSTGTTENLSFKVISDFNKTITNQPTTIESADENEYSDSETASGGYEEEANEEEVSDNGEDDESDDDNTIDEATLDDHQDKTNKANVNSIESDYAKNIKPSTETKLTEQVEDVVKSTTEQKNKTSATSEINHSEKNDKQSISNTSPNEPTLPNATPIIKDIVDTVTNIPPPPIKKDISIDINETPLLKKDIGNIDTNKPPLIKKDIVGIDTTEPSLTVKDSVDIDTIKPPLIKKDIVSTTETPLIKKHIIDIDTTEPLAIKNDVFIDPYDPLKKDNSDNLSISFNANHEKNINEPKLQPGKLEPVIEGTTVYSTILDKKLLPDMNFNNTASQLSEAQATIIPTISPPDSTNQNQSNNIPKTEDTSLPTSTTDKKTLPTVNQDSSVPNNIPKIQSDHESTENIHQATTVVSNNPEIFDKQFLQDVNQNASVLNHVYNNSIEGDFKITENTYQATAEVPVVHEDPTNSPPFISDMTPENVESLKRPSDFYKPYQYMGPNTNNVDFIENFKPDEAILNSVDDDSNSNLVINEGILNQEINKNHPTQDTSSLDATTYESTDSIWHHSFIDTLTNYLSFENLSSLLISASSFYVVDSRNMIGFDNIENQLVFGLSARMVLFILIVSASVLTFTLGYYFLDIRRQDGKLVAMVNSLQKDLLCYTKECDMLKDELTITKEKLAGIEDSSFGTDEMVISLRQDIQKRNTKIGDLEVELEKTVKELQSTTRAAEQLQSFIDEVLQWKDETKIEEDMAGIEKLQEENSKILEELELFKKAEVKAREDLISIQKLYEDGCVSLKIQQHEIDSLKKALQAMQGSDFSDEKLSDIIDQSEIRAQLTNALQERDLLATQLQNEKSSLGVLESELKTTIDSLQKAEQSTTRLEVLCDHFKKRESELVKEINSKESLWLSMKGETMTTVEKMQALQAEVQQYKEMCTELRRELAEAEVSRRSDEAELEKRAHTAWLEARKAQRDAEAHRAEAAALRRKLAVPQASSVPLTATLSPSLPLLPPPLPPPLLPPPPMQMRPPPLGRHPSPPYSPSSTVLANSPPPRYSDYVSNRDYPERRGRSPYSPSRRIHHRRRSYSNERYYDDDRRPSRGSHHNHMTETETDYSPPPSPRRRRSLRSPRHGPSSGSGRSSDSDK